jgi:hypothetical protein
VSLGTIGVLNVGAGDTKLVFDPSNPIELIRSRRIVTDMLRRGYALLIEVPDGNGGKRTTRVREFDESAGEYIIADFDPEVAAKADSTDEETHEGAAATGPGEVAAQEAASEARPKTRGRPRRVDAASVSGIAVARTAGG